MESFDISKYRDSLYMHPTFIISIHQNIIPGIESTSIHCIEGVLGFALHPSFFFVLMLNQKLDVSNIDIVRIDLKFRVLSVSYRTQKSVSYRNQWSVSHRTQLSVSYRNRLSASYRNRLSVSYRTRLSFDLLRYLSLIDYHITYRISESYDTTLIFEACYSRGARRVHKKKGGTPPFFFGSPRQGGEYTKIE